ncbi:hypothetical protein NW766_003900 [Fusarium irregulare]|uniref:Uncharacterized protein n=1 Tax=Fusarium irregulare TaxID=2494466 RepID=A0A9W8PU90_9HYPO|nr:hypothetical protein NW766_003900 [Fusarium irregulare]
MAEKRKITIMERKSGASTSKDSKVEELVPNQGTETWTVKNMRSKMEKKKLMGDWKPVGSWE